MSINDTFDGITDSVFVWKNKHPAPKSARGNTVAPPSKNCKGICDRISVGKPFKAYTVAAFCTRCGHGGTNNGVWILLKDLKSNGRCPCCNFRPRQKNFKQ